MNTIIHNNNKYKYINYYSNNKDSNGKKFPKLKSLKNPIANQSTFLNNLKSIENLSKLQKLPISQQKKHTSDCKICGQKNIFTGIYKHKNIVWRNDLLHNVSKHNAPVPIKFQSYIKKSNTMMLLQFKNLGNFNFKIKRNQLNILDSLLYSGGSKNIYEKNKKYYYSEHFGLLDFNKKGLETVLVDANTERVDEGDDSILMPTSNRKDLEDFEYIFHTHPPEKNRPGGRVDDGILYEFPSINDIHHFVYYHNVGKVNGSIVNTAEGLYIITIINNETNTKKLYFTEAVEKKLDSETNKIQLEAIKKYGNKFTDEKFYSVIAQNTSYIKRINNILKKNNLIIIFYPRIKNIRNKWVLPEFYINVNVVEQS